MIREMPSRDLTALDPGSMPAGPPPTLADYLAVLWRDKVWLVAATIVAGAIVCLNAFLVYKALAG